MSVLRPGEPWTKRRAAKVYANRPWTVKELEYIYKYVILRLAGASLPHPFLKGIGAKMERARGGVSWKIDNMVATLRHINKVMLASPELSGEALRLAVIESVQYARKHGEAEEYVDGKRVKRGAIHGRTGDELDVLLRKGIRGPNTTLIELLLTHQKPGPGTDHVLNEIYSEFYSDVEQMKISLQEGLDIFRTIPYQDAHLVAVVGRMKAAWAVGDKLVGKLKPKKK